MKRLSLALLFIATGITSSADAQLYQQTQPIQQFPIVQPGTVITSPPISAPIVSNPIILGAPIQSTNPFDACQCGSTPGGGECKCKDLHCELKLSSHCKHTRPLYKHPIPCEILGKIPKEKYEVNCEQLKRKFQYLTKVPQIHCTTEVCTEIGKKDLQCIPGCCFSVCVPTTACKTETVECKLVNKMMNLEIWERNDPERGLVYDVDVINDRNPSSEFHAGGMPAKWLVMHCGSKAELSQCFADAKKSDGSLLFTSVKKGTKPKATKADVDIKLVVKKAIVESYLKKEQDKVNESSEKEVQSTDEALSQSTKVIDTETDETETDKSVSS